MSNSSVQIRKIPLLGELWQRIEALPKPQPEDSIALRILVQSLVVVGIIATDVAVGEPLNLWAIPVSLVGATWSWYSRRRRNMPVKFCLAIGMLVALFAFLGRLVGELNDTREVLATLLIQLQVLHSFDLPSRKDLGYSMVIGLILLGVAGTLSQTLTFGPLLFLFLAIALPTLVLDYRSRLGLAPVEQGTGKLGRSPQGQSWWVKGFAPQRLGVLLVVIVAVGLLIFASMPRVPGYQLRTFPVSEMIDFQGEFDPSQVNNRGYFSEGQENGSGSGRGRSPTKGPGELDDTFYYGFNTTINQNLRGQMTPKVLMRVRSQAPGFWRVLAFDHYTGQGWEISRNEETVKVRRPTWSYQFFLAPLLGNNVTQEVIQSYTMVSDLPELIPALSWPKQVYFPTQEIAIDTEGSLRSPVELSEGLTYTVISEVPYRNRTALGEAGTNYPEKIKTHYLQMPPEIREKVRLKTEEILGNVNKVAQTNQPIISPYEKALYLAQYLKQNPLYKLQQNPPFLQDDEDLVEAFLFGYRDSPEGQTITGGYGDHFATVLTVMLRSIGIPARVVGGFDPGEFNPFTGMYVVKNTDAHLMTEVYFPNYGWFTFNPIPGMELIPRSVEENQTFSALQSFWKWVAGWLPSPVAGWLQTIFGFLFNGLAKFVAWFLALFARGWQGWLTGGITLTAIAFAGWLGWDQWQGWREHRRLARMHPIERVYQLMLKILAGQGYRKHPAQTPLEYAQGAESFYPPEQAAVISKISDAYVGWRYGGKAANFSELKSLLKRLTQVRWRRGVN